MERTIYCSITSNNKMTFLTFGVFMMKLQDAFKAVNPIDSAMQKLALLQQGTSGRNDHQP